MQNRTWQPIATLLLVAVILVSVVTPAFAQDLLATGQTTPVPADKNEGVPGPVPVPDDGTLQLGLPLQYVDTGLTVIDLNTGLEWEKKNSKDQVPNFGNLHDADNAYLWSGNGTQETIWDWLDDVNAEQYAGHSDWRIPNIRESQSILHYGRTNPMISSIFGPTRSVDYWSSTTRFTNPLRARSVNFGNGAEGVFDKNIAQSVRAVRGGQ